MDMGLARRRAGNNRYADYPDAPGFNPQYAGGVGTGQNGGMHDPGGKWIAGAIKKPGALHRQLGVPEGKKIPAKKMAAARAGKKGALAQKRATLAKTLSKF